VDLNNSSPAETKTPPHSSCSLPFPPQTLSRIPCPLVKKARRNPKPTQRPTPR